MDSTTLVSREQIASGEDLLNFLPSHGVPVAGAAWVQVESETRPYLYIVSPDVEAAPLPTTRRFVDAFRELEPSWTDPFRRLDMFSVRLLGPHERVAKALQFEYSRYNGPAPSVLFNSLGDMSVEGAYLYPATLFATAAAPKG